jgi:hypothetical protein
VPRLLGPFRLGPFRSLGIPRARDSVILEREAVAGDPFAGGSWERSVFSMSEADDRLAGDPVWELYPNQAAATGPDATVVRRYRYGLAVAGVSALVWLASPTLSVATACLAAAAPEFRTGWRLARSIPDKAAGRVCALFSYAWGTWKLALTAFALMFLVIVVHVHLGRGRDGAPPPAFLAASSLWVAGATASAALTAIGLLRAYRSSMRVWVGKGINRARTLLMAMLLVGFTYLVLVPLSLLLVALLARQGGPPAGAFVPLLFLFGSMFVGPIAILLVLDAFSRRIVADRPAKFGPKVSAVGKWSTALTDSAEL